MATRINKYLSEVGFCSRRAADILIEEGKVTINGEITEIGSKVEKGCLLYTSPSPRDKCRSRMPSSA